VILIKKLRDGVIAADVQGHLVGRHALGIDKLVARSRRSAGDATLEDKHSVVAQVSSCVLKAPNLVVLSEQVADRVVDEIQQPVPTSGADTGRVTDDHADLVAARFLAHPVDHVL
jgi:hypothetical protein